MIIESLLICAIQEALEEFENEATPNPLVFHIINPNNLVVTKECSICFEHFNYNEPIEENEITPKSSDTYIKELSCKKHFTCNECWYNYVKSRIGIDLNSNVCFICFPRESLLTSTAYDEHDFMPYLDYSILSSVINYSILLTNKILINSLYFHQLLYIAIYQADFTYIETNENDVIINLVNNKYMFHKYGLALTLYKKSKYNMGRESLTWINNNGILPINGVAVTNGGFIKAKIIHCNSPNPAGKNTRVFKNCLELCYINVFEKILSMDNIKRIYLPGIFARRVDDNDDISIQIAVKALYRILAIYAYDLKNKGIEEINIIDYGKNPKIISYLSSTMDNILLV